jgi:hypothetical protein
VLATIDLDYEPVVMTGEINNERPDWDLPPEA